MFHWYIHHFDTPFHKWQNIYNWLPVCIDHGKSLVISYLDQILHAVAIRIETRLQSVHQSGEYPASEEPQRDIAFYMVLGHIFPERAIYGHGVLLHSQLRAR